jgi:hypothetical protein
LVSDKLTRATAWLMMAQSFGVGTHVEMPVALAGAVSSVGASAIWFQWKNLFITPFYWLMAPIFRRIRRTTMAELVEGSRPVRRRLVDRVHGGHCHGHHAEDVTGTIARNQSFSSLLDS